ncbi:MAG: acyl-CoA dehydratase activase-related protein [Candidatus Margulisiibacteriota bacterium]|nr:acyl-CoA dehydratase activase-related protein [Candidatus Margulisiibacteriota bacterium]
MEKTKVYLGIDIGSISTNLVLMDEKKNVITKRYLPTAGRPIEAVKKGLAEIEKEIGNTVNVVGAGTTGSGRHMIGELVGADIIKNEITAQAAGALDRDPSVDTIFEIGGQDSKYIQIDNGAIVDFAMNKVCAAGTGSFLEEQAEKLGINIKEDFASLASRASSPSPLGDRCTVFIESELNNWQQKGESKENLTAGLATSIVKNYLNKVVENRRIGNKIFFQGGVAFNQAVVNAFKKVTGKKIILPPHHEVTGAIGIALLAMKEKNWQKSKFKGFGFHQKEYKISTFECVSCANVCEINKVEIENEKPLFYGGRCEKWEKRAVMCDTRYVIPDLYKEREKIIFSQKIKHGKKRIGIPRVLFMYEQFPFWNAFFTSLGLEVILSSPSNHKTVEASHGNVSTEACFPITLAHGHIQELVDEKPDFIFLPSLIDAEKASDKFNESFHCPFIQALPYFARAGIEFDPGIKALTPPLEPQRGKNFFAKQLTKLSKELGKSKKETIKAIHAADKEQQKARKQIKKRGREILRKIEKENIPALAIISRPYNGSDPLLNLDIPKKLKDMGVLAIPIDFLPIDRSDIADDHPNMYWNYGQKIMAAGKFINEHPNLSAVHITNFRCGPDSFISHLLKDKISSKPFLQIEVDEHSSDTGVITRLEAFLDSLKNAMPLRHQGTKEHKEIKKSKKRILYLPRMADHAEALAAAIRAYGAEAVVLPRSDKETIEIGKKYSSGKECHPFIVTTGDIIKKVQEPGFDPEKSAFFMPTASGPCRFGHYREAQQIILKNLGYPDIPLVSPDAKNGYAEMLGLKLGFRRAAWQGVVAIDILTKLTHRTRPYEKHKGEIDRIHDLYLQKIIKSIESRNGIFDLMKKMNQDYRSVIKKSARKPVIGIVGEIFLRLNSECNAGIVHRVEALGGEARVAPIFEWGYYTNLGYMYESVMRRLPHFFFLALFKDLVQKWDEYRLSKPFKDVEGIHEPSTLSLLRAASPYLHHSFKGEAVLTIGKAIDFISNGASGIINVMPFTCMPGTVASALSKKVRKDHGDFPWMDLPIDENEGVNLDTRLEAFMHQAVHADRKG